MEIKLTGDARAQLTKGSQESMDTALFQKDGYIANGGDRHGPWCCHTRVRERSSSVFVHRAFALIHNAKCDGSDLFNNAAGLERLEYFPSADTKNITC
jgi:hypothetical protein